MLTEGFDELEDYGDSEKSTRRAYVSNVSQEEVDRLLSENDRLTKALEKEQFFNKLLDQEIQELKSNQGQTSPQISSYWYGNKGVSKGAFYSLLFVALAMAGYIGYGIYYDKEFDYINTIAPGKPAASGEASPTFTTPSGNGQDVNSGNAQPGSNEETNNTPPTVLDEQRKDAETAPVRDSVPNIVAVQPEQERFTDEFEEKEPVAPPKKPALKEIDVEKTRTDIPAGPVDTRPVIARYRITSKANFYSAPDENTMRGTFISQGDDKVVGALEDRNGFIYVVYTNDLGYTSRGWLSKKDLTEMR